MSYIFVSLADYIEIRKNNEKNEMPLYISDGDDMVYCDEKIYEELVARSENFTKVIDVNLIIKQSQ